MVEAFCSPPPPNEPLAKRSRLDEDLNVPALTASSTLPPSVLHSFVVAVRCWDLLHVNEFIDRGKFRFRQAFIIIRFII